MSSNFFNINPQDGESNIGGILNRVRLIPVLMISSFEPPALNDIVLGVDAIRLKADSTMVDFVVAHGTGSFSQEMQENEHGESYFINLNVELPKERPSVATFLHRNRKYGYLAVVEDKNGYVHILGCMAQPLFIKGNVVSSGSLGQKNNRVLTLTTNQEHEAYYLGNGDALYDMQVVFSDNRLDTVLREAVANGKIAMSIKEEPFSVINHIAIFSGVINTQAIIYVLLNKVPMVEHIDYRIDKNRIVFANSIVIDLASSFSIRYMNIVANSSDGSVTQIMTLMSDLQNEVNVLKNIGKVKSKRFNLTPGQTFIDITGLNNIVEISLSGFELDATNDYSIANNKLYFLFDIPISLDDFITIIYT